MENTSLTHLSDADLLTLENLLESAEKRGGLSKRVENNFPNGSTYDTKYVYHIVRLLNEVEQILVEGDLDLQRNREQLKEIRRGEWTLEQVETYFETKERVLEVIYANSQLPHSPDEDAIKKLLVESLEMHYGSLANAVKIDVDVDGLIRDLQDVIDKHKK
jgi:hypothetical protein